MRPETGRVIRRFAYLIEAVCMFGLLSIARDRVAVKSIAGVEVRHWLSAGLALGITLWIVGTAALYWPRKTPSQRES